jgi:hypothetical protein
MTALAVVGLGVASIPAGATIVLSVFGDSYIVRDGGRTYSVLDVYMKGSNPADIVGSVFGTTQYPSLFLYEQWSGVHAVERYVRKQLASDQRRWCALGQFRHHRQP